MGINKFIVPIIHILIKIEDYSKSVLHPSDSIFFLVYAVITLSFSLLALAASVDSFKLDVSKLLTAVLLNFLHIYHCYLKKW